jgi:hypothetical protein
MRSRQIDSIARGARLSVVSVAVLACACAGRTAVRSTVDDPGRVDVGQLWVEPRDLESRDLFHGVGGASLAPDPSAVYDLVAVDDSGYSAGYDVRDPQGTLWSVKLGIEAQPELVASRVLWAMGYHQPLVYVLTHWTLADKQQSSQALARFRREPPNQKVGADWSWYENPFVTTQAFRGLVVASLILNNWDWKTSNNKIYDVTEGDRTHRIYVVRDLGASLGKTSFPSILKWTPFRAMAQGSRNDIVDFEEQGFIRSVEDGRVEFDYRGVHTPLVNMLTVNDVVWTCKLMARISDRQWRDAFRAAGYDDAAQQRYIAKLKSKISEGLALANASAGG